MKYITVKDFKRREHFVKNYKKRFFSYPFLRDKLLLQSKYFNFNKMYSASRRLSSIRYSSLSRIRNRCNMTGKGRAVLSTFKVSRIAIREVLSRASFYGLSKRSW